MNNKKRNIIISVLLLFVAIIYTALVKTIDVAPVGADGTDIGFSTINTLVVQKIGTNMYLYKITKYLGLIPIVGAGIYALIGLKQLIKRKSLKKVDLELYALAGFYIVVAAVYFFFEKFIINYRPILMEGMLEASYPSSHTMITICLCGASILINKQLFDNKFTRVVNVVSVILTIVIVIGRFISGVHWTTDIVGGLLLSLALLMCLSTVFKSIKFED